MGYTLSFYAYDLVSAIETLAHALPGDVDDLGEIMLLRFDHILNDGAVPLGGLDYLSHSGNEFHSWFQSITETVGVDLTRLEHLPSLNPASINLDFPTYGGLTRNEIDLAVERLTVMEKAGTLDDTSQELLILLERAQQRQSDIVTQLS